MSYVKEWHSHNLVYNFAGLVNAGSIKEHAQHVFLNKDFILTERAAYFITFFFFPV